MAYRAVLPVLILISLSACGGGGGGAGTPPPVASSPPAPVAPAPAPVVPVTPPDTPAPVLPPLLPSPPPAPPLPVSALVPPSFHPLDGAAGVARTASVTAAFGSELAAATLTSSNVSLTAPNGAVLPATLTAAGSELRLAPSFALPGDTSYTVRIAGTLADTAGRTLATAASTSFTTAPQSWNAAPAELDTLTTFLYAYEVPALVADRAGNLTATWVRTRLGDTYAARFDAVAGTWSTPRMLNESPELAVRRGPLLATPNGDVFQYWLEGKWVDPDLEEAQLRFVRFDKATGTWTAPTTAAFLPPGHSARRLEMAMDEAGRVTALVTNASMSGEHAVYALRLDRPGGVWSAPVALDRPGARTNSAFYMSIAPDAAGNVFAAWNEYEPSGAFFVARYDVAQGSWSPARQLSAGGGFGGGPGTLSVNGAGVAAVAWSETDSALGSVARLARFDPVVKAWDASVRLDNADGAIDPMVVVDAAGSLVATWKETLSVVVGRRFDASKGQWSEPRRLLDTPYALNTERRMAVDVAGNVILLVVESKKMKALRYRSSDDSWSAGQRIDTTSHVERVIYAPALAMDAGGVATAVWFATHELNSLQFDNEVLVNRFR